jgi:hypothetical protein
MSSLRTSSQTALDYAEPAQRALLVEGIRPVLPLIRNTPYGKRIQNKLQRDQMDHFGGGSYHSQQVLAGMALGNQSIGLGHHGPGRPMATGIHPGNPLDQVYAPQYTLQAAASLQGQASFGQGHLNAQLHGLQAQSIEGYVLQGTSTHNQPLSHSVSQGGVFSGVSTFANVSPFGGVRLSGSPLNDPYQRSSFGYGM